MRRKTGSEPSAFLVKIGLVELQKFSYAVTQDSPGRAPTGHTRTLEVEQLVVSCFGMNALESNSMRFYEESICGSQMHDSATCKLSGLNPDPSRAAGISQES